MIYLASEPGTQSPNGFSEEAFIVFGLDISYIEKIYQRSPAWLPLCIARL